ncbi:hypothetical protein [Streptomyces sp. NBC_01508]|uniref:aromatic-ring hydroxylase C-terminal domain-containing protein n=1 Tax=Streptomyces sp. NBC_01508 TaxID=2903888 RepID=UPI00386F4C09
MRRPRCSTRTRANGARGPHLTLLVIGTDAELPPLDGDLVHVRHLRHQDVYEAYGKGLFLVRPDGYIGWAGEDATGLGAWLAKLGGETS